MYKGVVIGGGVAGLVSASLLAARGYQVTLLEKQTTLGGALQEIKRGDYTFELGPTTITMPWLLERVFHEVGQEVDPALQFARLAINSRHFFADGTAIDLATDSDYMSQQMARLSPHDRQGFLDYLAEIQYLYETVSAHFLTSPLTEWKELFSPRLLKAFLSVYPFRSMDSFHRQFVSDPRLLAMMNRYANVLGSSPYQTPATLSFISYLENVLGVYYIEGGSYRLVEALERLARSLGVEIIQGCAVDELVVQMGNVIGVRAGEEKWVADVIIASVDVGHLLQPTPIRSRVESSSSQFLCLFGIKEKYSYLRHHNYFFPEDYGREFIDIFEQNEWSCSPAFYVYNSSYSEGTHARNGVGSNLIVAINVPANSTQQDKRALHYREHMLSELEERWGLSNLRSAIEVEKIIGPIELEAMSGTMGGSVAGPVSHRMNAFFRPPTKHPDIAGLYHANSSTQMGKGLAMDVLSAFHAVQLVEWDYATPLLQASYK